MNMPALSEEELKALNIDDLYSVLQGVLIREQKIEDIDLTAEEVEQEYFWVIGLDEEHRMLFIESGNCEDAYSKELEPMKIFSVALQKQAKQIVLCRSIADDSENPQPKKGEKDAIDRLLQIGKIVNMPIIDHQIISPKNFLSFEKEGIMQELQQSLKYVPSYELAHQIQEQAAALLQQKEAENKAKIQQIKKELKEAQEKNYQNRLQIAQDLKEEGIEVDIIIKVTGLSLKEVEGL